MMRYALITSTSDRDNIAAYMPGNYEVIYSEPSQEWPDRGWTSVVIAGRDNAGWTLDGYVLPRLASGLMNGREIDLSHDIMKRVPERSTCGGCGRLVDPTREHCDHCGYPDGSVMVERGWSY